MEFNFPEPYKKDYRTIYSRIDADLESDLRNVAKQRGISLAKTIEVFLLGAVAYYKKHNK